METWQALQRCLRSTLHDSTRHTFRSSTSCSLHLNYASASNISRRLYSSSQSRPGPALRDFLADLKRDTSTTQSSTTQTINDKLDNLPWGQSARTPTSGASNIRTFDGLLGRNAGAFGRSPSENDFLAEINRGVPDFYEETQLRLKPSLGRTVNVSGGDPARAFRMLERKCNENQVRLDERKQKFHVRKGQLKKILRMQRWRALFKEGFIAECAKIRRMRKQGW